MKAQLIPLDGGKPITINRDVTLVGRKRGLCDLIVDRGSVSKLHCLIVKTDGLLFIRDLGSTNGTKVNGQKVTRGALLPDDELAFAGAKFRVYLGPADANDEEEVGPDEQTEAIPAYDDGADAAAGDDEPLDADLFDDVPLEPAFSDDNSDSDVRLVPDDST
jgi:predicted component of type VI protein secretion system